MMRAPNNMAAITASLEKSLQNCSLNRRHRHGASASASSSGDGIGRSSSSDDLAPSAHHHRHGDAALELNSHISLPYHWEQCLDLATGEIYYIDWRNGTKAKEDPRVKPDVDEDDDNGGFYSTDESSYDSEESSSESSPSTTSRTTAARDQQQRVEKDHVLVVAGCKICLMYFMVPKQVEDCPKCGGQLLHFDRSDNVSGSP
ncbi:protein CURLY FLAG LEAF 1 [Syzygium oleosum]|uniref:protein CURLY FLAG LEAF 1 n=1 Tax=Syzygium oleosum TaxID=219896 RepID=UPI0011D208AD|nr:protein CURLY FLAG LEAF 1 [Syzygium oleosum]